MPKLTDTSVRALKAPPSGTATLWDTSLKNFGVRVSSKGTRTFIVLIASGRRLAIGRFPTITLSEARAEAKRILAEKTLGNLRTKSKRFEDAYKRYVSAHLDVNNKPSSAAETKRLIKSNFLPKLRFKRLDEIETSAVMSIVDALPPSSGNHAFAAIRGFFRWAVSRKYMKHSPLEGLRLPNGAPSRDRVLSDDELKRVWTAAEQMGTFGIIVRLLILTGQRRGEIAALQAEWIAEDRITLPSWLTKNGREHTFPIGKTASAQLIPLVSVSRPFFPAKGKDTPFNGWSKSKPKLDALSETKDWTLHDLRRTFATGLAALGTPIHVTEKILNHVSGTTGGLVSVYQRHRFWDEQVTAIANWENKLSALFSL